MEKRYTLITGATGFIGSHVAQRLLAESHYLIAIVRKATHYKNVEELKQKGAVLVEGNFYDRKLIENTFANFPIENIVHIAALRGGGAGTKDDYSEINILGTERLLQAAFQYNISRFVFISSVGVMGTIPDNLPGDSTSRFNGDNLYHESKVVAEKKVHMYIEKGLNACILRPAITYGTGDNGFPKTLVKLVKEHLLPLPTRDIKIHLLDVGALSDLVVTILRSDKPQHNTYIVADATPISLRALVDEIHTHYHNKEYPVFLKVPNILYRILLHCFLFSHNEKWATRLRLISHDWYYDIGMTVKDLAFKPSDTTESFVRSMCN